MNKFMLVFLCFLLVGSLFAQEPALPDSVIQEPVLLEQVPPDSIAAVPVLPEQTVPEPVPQVQIPEEQVTSEQLLPEPIQQDTVPQEQVPQRSAPRPPVPPGLVPPQAVLPALIAPKTAPMKPAELTNYGQMIYWKSLTQAEKKVFLFAYLFRTYESLEQVKAERELKSVVKPFQKKIADPVFDLFRNLDEKQKDDLAFWIDIFYRNDLNKDKSFSEALRYAGEKMKTGSRSMYDIYKENYK